MPGEFIAVVAIVMALSIPIVAILVNHQRKMAELLHGRHAQTVIPLAEVEALRREVAELRQIMVQQAIALDDVPSGAGFGAGESAPIVARLGR